MADDQQFCLRWNNFQTNFTSQFKTLRVDEDFVDVTLACEGKRIKAHKLVLSACSPYFKELFKSNPCKHPIIFMQDVEYEHLMNLVEFMYAGQVNICQNKLPAFLHTAESLQIRGLSQNKLPQNSERKANDLRPAPTLNDSPGPSSPETDRREDGLPLPSSKRVCMPDTNSHHSQESTSYSPDVPTTALIETKMEPMDYYSDGEVKPNISHIPDGHRSGFNLQGALDAAASMSAQISQIQETQAHESLQDVVGEMCKPHSLDGDSFKPPSLDCGAIEPYKAPTMDLVANDSFKPHSLDPRPCPECGRIYSNISNLRQHIRLIHYPECITCPLCFKPFKNKLYLRRHVMSYHEVNLPSQNDLRYKYQNLGNNSQVFTTKSEAPEGFYGSKRIKPEVYASLMASSKQFDGRVSDNITALPEIKYRTRNQTLTEKNVPNT